MPRLELGIDQYTLTCFSAEIAKMQSNPEDKHLNSDFWASYTNFVLNDLLKRSKLEDVFGENIVTMQYGLTQGYDCGYTFEHYKVAICWHSNFAFWRMGVSLRFSAEAWHTYCDNYRCKYNKPMNMVTFLQQIPDNHVYTTRLSRIDLTADCFDYDNISPEYIHEGLSNGYILALNSDGAVPFRTIRAIETNGIHETIELGSKQSPVFVVLYNKRAESIAKHGYRYDDAIRCKSWMRIEVRFHDELAHQISYDLKCMQPKELKAYIAKRIVERYGFYSNNTHNTPIPVTKDLLDIADGCPYGSLSSPTPRDNDLIRSRDYLTSTSGLFSWLFKIRMTYDDVPGADRIAMDFLFDVYQRAYLPDAYSNYELTRWLDVHRTESRKRTLQQLLV